MSDASANPLELALRVTGILEALGIRYLVGGSVASTTFGEPRATLDVDLVVDLPPPLVGEFIRRLGGDFVVDEQWIRDEIRRHGSFQMLYTPSMARIDVFVPDWSGVHLWKWERRRRVVVSAERGEALDVTSPEGIVIQKLGWYRDGGEVSDRQWRDVLGVLKTCRGDLDRGELSAWADRMDVRGLLERALVEAGLQAGR